MERSVMTRRGVVLQIITRSGVPYTLSNLKKVAVWDADNVILLQPEGGEEEPKVYEHSSKMATTIYGLHQHAKKRQNVVVRERAACTPRAPSHAPLKHRAMGSIVWFSCGRGAVGYGAWTD